MTKGSSSESRPTTCNVVLVGAGYMAREHIRAFQDVPGVQVVGIQSRTQSRAQALADEFGIPGVYDTIAAMYAATQANLVVVTVPELQTNEVCTACFEHPWSVLIEKPAGYNLDDAVAIAGNAALRGRRAFVALNRRHYASTRTMRSDLANLSGPRFIKLQDQEDAVGALRAGQPALVVENWMYANSIHVIDYFTMLGRGRVVDVERVIPWNPQTGYVVAKVTFDSGDVGLYEAVWNGPGPWAVTVNTPEKRWELRPVERAAFQLAGKRVLEPVEPDPIDTVFKPGLRVQAELAARAALGEDTELPTLDDALVSMRLTQAIYGT